jgi:predicted nucleotidyltransferase
VVDIPAWIDELCRPLVDRLCSIDGVEALVLGGSQARGTAWPDSDVDIALGYYPGAPFSIEELDRAASELDDQHRTGLVTNFGEWGPGVNGGGWLVIDDNHVDFLYRDLARVREVILRCCEGKPEAWNQLGHPMGFQSQIYIGEVDCCVPLYDPAGEIAALKALIPQYQERLRRALVEKHLFDAEFESALAEKPARRGDIVYANGMMFARASSWC